MDRARIEEYGGRLYRKLVEYGSKKMIFTMERERTENGIDMKRCAVIKDNYGRLIIET